MSRIYKRVDSPFWYYTTGTSGNRIQRSTKSTNKQVAKMIQAKWDQQYVLQQNGLATPDKSLNEFFIEYRKLIAKRKSYAWSKRIIQHLNNFMDHVGDMQLSKIDTAMIDRYIDHRLGSVSNKTVRDEVASISAMLKIAQGYYYINGNPCDNAMLPDRVTKNPRKDIPFDLVEKAIANAVHDRDRILWTILLYTGLRSGDAGSLKRENFKNGFIDLEPEKTSRFKTKVVIPIHPRLMAIGIDNLINVMPRPGYRSGSLLRFKAILKELGYDEPADLHSIRHTFSTRLAELGLAPDIIRLITGHRKTEMTMQYTHVVDLIKTVYDKL